VLARRNPVDAEPWEAVPVDAGPSWARVERQAQQRAEAAEKRAQLEISARAAEAELKGAESAQWHDAPSAA
jgi:hypothetical protein